MAINEPRFFGGMAGFFAYDMVYSLCDKVERHRHPGKTTPLAQFMLAQDCIVCDHPAAKLYVFSNPLLTEESDPGVQYDRSVAIITGTIQRLEELRHGPPFPGVPESLPDMPIPGCRRNVSKNAFKESVARVKEYIAGGDILQAVISQKTECPFDADPFSVYLALREINPGPYLYFLDFGERQVIGSSPEMLVRVENRQVTTVPIAGTRPRGRDEEEDCSFAKDLLADEKERAEHTMLVDLARNDVGRVSDYGTVMVENFMAVEKFSHVQHIVSTVTGELRGDLDAFDALKACFPAGTVSGAPKIRAMQIIEELETGPRGIYAGAAGYIGFNGNMDFAIAIRTIVIEDGIASIQAGAGIVADSVPENEFQETLFKAKAMQTALLKAGAVR
jgi:anthranilate synthase component 1